MGGIVGQVKKKRIGVLPDLAFLDKVQGKIRDGMSRVKGFAVQSLGDGPLLAVQAKAIVSGKEVAGSRKVPPIAFKPKIRRLFA